MKNQHILDELRKDMSYVRTSGDKGEMVGRFHRALRDAISDQNTDLASAILSVKDEFDRMRPPYGDSATLTLPPERPYKYTTPTLALKSEKTRDEEAVSSAYQFTFKPMSYAYEASIEGVMDVLSGQNMRPDLPVTDALSPDEKVGDTLQSLMMGAYQQALIDVKHGKIDMDKVTVEPLARIIFADEVRPGMTLRVNCYVNHDEPAGKTTNHTHDRKVLRIKKTHQDLSYIYEQDGVTDGTTLGLHTTVVEVYHP